MHPAKRPLYLGLTRVSTEEQATNGHSLDWQDHTLTAEAAHRGVDIEIIRAPGRTGSKVSPELRGALERLARGEAAGLMVAKLDRLTRSVAVADDIIKAAEAQGWNLVLLDLGVDLNTAAGRMMARLVATFAEFERELISERTRAGLEAAKRNGTKTGRPIGRPALVSPDLVNEIVFWRNEGTSFAAIAEHLAARGELSPEGRPTWQASTVRRIYNRSTEDGGAA
jgi:DNA invertase Pin-like site-specific DNA recombinase